MPGTETYLCYLHDGPGQRKGLELLHGPNKIEGAFDIRSCDINSLSWGGALGSAIIDGRAQVLVLDPEDEIRTLFESLH